jgi:hypothetical protein
MHQECVAIEQRPVRDCAGGLADDHVYNDSDADVRELNKLSD